MTMDDKKRVKLRLELQEVVPYLNLPSNNGVNVNLWDFKQRKNLVLIFHHGRACNYCSNKLKELAKAYKEIQFLEAEVLAISFDNIEDLKGQWKEDALPFPSVFITDRFGALHYQKIAEEATGLPSASEILSVLDLIQIE